MTFLPIVERELRVAARRRSAFRTRLAAAVAAITLGAWTLWFGADWQSAGGMGMELFRALTSCAFIFCLGAGPLFTADTLSAERREGTLGLLFLTDLHGYDIVLGKLAGAAVPALFSLLAILPVLALPLLLGGVSLAQFGGMALALGNALFLSLALGMVVSVWCQEARSALAMTVFLLFLLCVCVPVVGRALAPTAPFAFGLPFIIATPVTALGSVLDAQFALSNPAFLASLLGTQAMAWLALLGASRAVPHGFHERPVRRADGSWQAIWHQWNFGNAAQRRRFRRHLLEQNPVCWLASRNRLKPLLLYWLVGLSLVVWLAGGWLFSHDWWNWSMTVAVALFLQAPLKWLMASEASQGWAEDRKTGALELLLTTPLTVPEMLHGQMRASWRLFARPVLAVLVTEIVLLAVGTRFSGGNWDMAGAALVAMVVFVWDLHALRWVGAWQGLVKPKPNQAFAGAVWRVLVLPWVLFLTLLFLVGARELNWTWIVWLFVCGATNTYFTLVAREELHHRFRQLAAETFSERRAEPI